MTQNLLTEIGFVVNQEDQGRQQNMNIDIVPHQTKDQFLQNIKRVKENLSETKEVLDECQGRQEQFCTTYYNLKEKKKMLESKRQQVNNYINAKFLTLTPKVLRNSQHFTLLQGVPDILVKFWIS